MSKVKLELPETGAKDEAQTETQDGEPKDVQDLTGFLWILVAASYNFYLFKNFVSNVYCKVQTLLQQMQDKFQDMSDQIINRIDEMGARIDDLEKNIGELMTQAGVDEPEK